MTEEDPANLLVRVDIPDIKTQKCVVLSVKDTVWAAKQVVLDKLNQDLPFNLLNYGLYLLPSVPGKLGKYMDDGRFLGDYVFHGHVPRLEMRYKRRDYSIQVSLKGKDISKANTKANHRKFVEQVIQGSVKKIEKMLDSGVDPNFITDDGNTPLGVACGRNSNIQMIRPLLSNGAHIDFRGKDGLTPLHRAALGGNSAAIKILLSYGASPNYRDAKGLTPLYHTAIMGDDTACCESLLRYRAELGIRDHAGWTELHQATRYGHVAHADLLVKYGADLHAQNNAGNTPLHVAASHGQAQLAMLLLTRGTDQTILNFSNQLAAQVAILCGHHTLSAEISGFQPHQVERIKDPPDYHPSARQFDPNLFNMEQNRTEVSPAVPSAETLVDTLTQEWTERDLRDELTVEGKQGRGGGGGVGLMWNRTASGSSHSIPSITGAVIPQTHHSLETADSESLSSYDRDSIHSTSTTGGTPGPNTSQTHHRRQPNFSTQRERLYRAGPGRYVVVEDVDPQQSEDIPLRRGMDVEVEYIGKGGYWEGKAGGRQGWFPARAIQEVIDDGDSGVFSESSLRSATIPTMPMASVPEHQLLPPPPPMQQGDLPMARREMDTGFLTDVSGLDTQPGMIPYAEPIEHYNVREVVVKRSTKGYGFAMRGVKATKTVTFTPTPQVPALQYIGNVEPGGSADLAGLKTGDFLLEINNHNVTYSTHDDVVNIIRNAGKSLRMKVITPLLDPTMRTSVQLQQQVEISNNSNTLDQRDRPRMDELPAKTDTLPSAFTMGHTRETVIDDVPRQQLRKGEESPSLDRINQSGWDSSPDEAVPTPESSNHRQKFSYLSSGAGTLPITHKHSPRQHTLPSPSQSSKAKPFLSKNERAQTFSENTVIGKSATLSSHQQRDQPASSSSSDEEVESEFTKAVKKGKANLTNSPARKRSSTMPSKATRGRSLAGTNKDNSNSRESGLKTSKNAPSMISQPLAQAIMRKIDSIRINQEDEFSDDEEEPKNSPPRPKSYSGSKDKAAPPAPAPKPQMRRADTVDPSCIGGVDKGAKYSSQLSSTSDKQAQSDKEESLEEESGTMNWKSVLRPVQRTASGRGVDDYSRSRSNSSGSITKSPRKTHVKPSETTSGFGNEVNNGYQHSGRDPDVLPPPLPIINNRLSAEFLELPPPVDFMSVPGVETGETNTDDIIPPPRHRARDSESSPSPPPPPPPDSSPPRELLNNSGDLAGLQFSNGLPAVTHERDADNVPSPIPSPLNPSSFDADIESEALMPPYEFTLSKGAQDNVGFEIPTPPNDDRVTSQSNMATHKEPDLDEAIRQLQQLSDDLTPTPVEKNKHSSPKKSEMSTLKTDEPVTVKDSQIYVSPARNRSSTSSSNVSQPRAVSENQNQISREPEDELSTTPVVPVATAKASPMKGVLEWEVEEVCEWLEEIGLGEHCSQFRENEILGEHLLELTKEELAELGVKKIGHKKTFLNKVKELMPSS